LIVLRRCWFWTVWLKRIAGGSLLVFMAFGRGMVCFESVVNNNY
jgi:hypothetical protein